MEWMTILSDNTEPGARLMAALLTLMDWRRLVTFGIAEHQALDAAEPANSERFTWSTVSVVCVSFGPTLSMPALTRSPRWAPTTSTATTSSHHEENEQCQE